jgi:multidrug efflux pump subunit AcrA (membrane-fusion protein)
MQTTISDKQATEKNLESLSDKGFPIQKRMPSNSHLLPTVRENEFLPPISRWTTIGGLVILGVVGAAIAIASVAKYKVTVKAPANFRPAGELRIVQAATEGAIERIFVKGNQSVKKGEVIATIDDSRGQTKKSQLQSNVTKSRLQLVRIDAQINALDNQMIAERDRINRTVAAAKAELSQRSRDRRDRQITSNAEVQEAKASLMQSQQELLKAQAELKSTEANLKSAEASLSAAKSKQHRYESIAKEGAISKDLLEEARLASEQQQQAVEAQKAEVQKQQQAIAQQQQAVKASEAKLQGSQAALNPSTAEVAIASERIAQEQAAGIASLATLDKERENLLQQRIELNKQLANDVRELQQVEIDLKRTAITATADGIVAKLNLRNPGQTVSVGEEIVQLVPRDASLEIKASVPPQERSKLKVGQNVQMRVSACPHPDYGTLKGTVSQISKDTVKPENNNPTANAIDAFYEVTIKPESLSLDRGTKQCSVQLGMEGTAEIISREETVLQFFLRKARLIADL